MPNPHAPPPLWLRAAATCRRQPVLINTPSAVHSLVLALARARLLRLGKKGPEAVHSGRLSRGRPVAGAGARPFSRQCAGAFGRVPGGRVVEAKYSKCLRNEEIIFGAGFSTENRRNQSIIRRKLVLIRTSLIFV